MKRFLGTAFAFSIVVGWRALTLALRFRLESESVRRQGPAWSALYPGAQVPISPVWVGGYWYPVGGHYRWHDGYWI